MSVDHISVSFSRLSLAKATKTADAHDVGVTDVHEPWKKSVIFHQPQAESKMLQTMQKPMRRLLSRHFSKRRSAPITPSITDDTTPPKHFPHDDEADEPSPELSKYTMPRPIPQDNTMHRDKHPSMHRRTSSTPPPQSLSSAAAVATTKQPLRSCLKRSSKSADADDIAIESSDMMNVNRTSVEIGGNTSKRDHYHSHARTSPTLMSKLDATHHRSRSVGDLHHTQSPMNRPPTPRQVSDNSIIGNTNKPTTTMPSRRVSFRDSLYSSRQSAGISPDVYSQKSTAPVTYPYHQTTRGTRNAATTTQQYSSHQHESPEKKHVRIAEDAIRGSSSSNSKRNSSSSKEPSYNLKSSTDARRRAEILRNQRPQQQHHPVAMHTASSPYMGATPPSPSSTPLPMIPLIVPSPSPHPTSPPSSYGIPIVFHPNGATATPVPGIHMMPSHHHHHHRNHHSHRRSMHR